MADKTSIEWTQATWNPVAGCSRVSPGCDHCYAIRSVHRMGANPLVKQIYEGLTVARPDRLDWNATVRLVPNRLYDPFHWRGPKRVFVNSLSDLFHPKLTIRDIARVWVVMVLTPHITYQVLTKRPERMLAVLTNPDFYGLVLDESRDWRAYFPETVRTGISNPALIPARNIWLGTSVEDQQRADERIPYLLATPAAVRFLSCEPLLGPVNLRPYLPHAFNREPHCPWCEECIGPTATTAKRWELRTKDNHSTFVDWVITGGESGPGFRPLDLDWARSLRDVCGAASVPFFFKQHGGPRPKSGGKLLDGAEWQQFPEVRV